MTENLVHGLVIALRGFCNVEPAQKNASHSLSGWPNRQRLNETSKINIMLVKQLNGPGDPGCKQNCSWACLMWFNVIKQEGKGEETVILLICNDYGNKEKCEGEDWEELRRSGIPYNNNNPIRTSGGKIPPCFLLSVLFATLIKLKLQATHGVEENSFQIDANRRLFIVSFLNCIQEKAWEGREMQEIVKAVAAANF